MSCKPLIPSRHVKQLQLLCRRGFASDPLGLRSRKLAQQLPQLTSSLQHPFSGLTNMATDSKMAMAVRDDYLNLAGPAFETLSSRIETVDFQKRCKVQTLAIKSVS